MTMDASLKAKWVGALRSGEYRQGQSRLHDPDTNSYCCLGVLCKVIGADFTDAEIEKECDEGFYVSTQQNVPVLDGRPLISDDSEELSAAFCKEIGLLTAIQGDLIVLNDGYGKPGEEHSLDAQPFTLIANYIEQNL